MLLTQGLTSSRKNRHLVVVAAIKSATGSRLMDSAPLLKEKRYPILATLPADGDDPFSLHWPRTKSAFAANNYPVNP
jgi:hypothetical protein